MSASWLWYAALLALGALLYVVCGFYPATLPAFLPWEFSWPEFLVTGLTLAWFARGLRILPPDRQPALWRKICFVAGILSFYIVLQTHIDYYAQHMFFVHRAAHFVLHHLGAFLIAIGMSGPVLYAGMPAFLRPVVDCRPMQGIIAVLQNPVLAPVLFVGLLYFWLIPSIHTRVMLDANLYELMNWTMAVNGVMFWSLILDSRGRPPARLSHLGRAALILVIELPQMVLGAILSLSMSDYYPVYQICGRVLDMTALNDQHYGGLIIWLPGTLTSFAAMIVVLVTMRLNEERAEREKLLSLCFLLALTAGARAAPAVIVSDAWFRFLPAGLPAGGYFIARNAGKSDLAITGAQSAGCGMLMLHRSSDKGGMSGMDMVDKVALPAGGTARFTPGGYHLMCMDAKMKIGTVLPVVIQLSDGTSVAARFAVRDARGK